MQGRIGGDDLAARIVADRLHPVTRLGAEKPLRTAWNWPHLTSLEDKAE